MAGKYDSPALERMQQSGDALSQWYSQNQAQKMAGQQHLEAIKAQGAQQQALDQAKQKSALETLGQLQNMGLPEGSHAKVNDVGYSTPDASQRIMRQQAISGKEAQQLNNQYLKNIEQPAIRSLQSHRSVLDALSEGTEIGDKKAQVAAASLIEGQGQKLLKPVIESMGGNKTAFGGLQGFSNWASGNSNSKLSPEQRDAMKQLMLNNVDNLTQDYTKQHEQFMKKAPGQAPNMSATGQLQPYLQNFGSTPQEMLKDLQSRHQQFKQQQQAAPGGTPAARPTYEAPQGPMDHLKRFLTGGSQAQSAGPDAQDQAAMQWLQANPHHDAAAGVAAKLKAKGLIK